jgi:uncharacterized protein YciI
LASNFDLLDELGGLYHLGMKRTIGVATRMLCLLSATLFAGAFLAVAQTPAPTPNPAASPANPGAAPAAPVMKTWFLRLVPPRPTFDKDMTDAEGALMEQHFIYWKGQFDKGVCFFGGPVLDPRGVYGVLAIRAATEEEARAIADADPSVRAGLNKMEVAEMKLAFLMRAK